MPRTSSSLDSSEGSHFSGRPPPPYHLVDVTKQFSFDYAISTGHESELRDLCAVFSEQEQEPGSKARFSFNYAIATGQESELKLVSSESSDQEQESRLSIDRRPFMLKRAFAIEDLKAATPLLDDLRLGHISASNPVLDALTQTTAAEESAISVFSSEDGGVKLPPPSESGSLDMITGVQLGNLAPVPEQSLPIPLRVHRRPEATAIIRAVTSGGPARARGEATLIARGLTAGTNHQQYASHRRHYDRYRNISGTTLPSTLADSGLAKRSGGQLETWTSAWSLGH